MALAQAAPTPATGRCQGAGACAPGAEETASLGGTEPEEQPVLLTSGLGSPTAPQEQRALVCCLALLCFPDHFTWCSY